MIYRLRRRLILISTVSVLTVVTLVFFAIFALNVTSMNRNLDILADTVSEGGGRFPSSFGGGKKPDGSPQKENGTFDFITPEIPFSTRHFTVLFDNSGNTVMVNTDSIYSVNESAAVEYANEALGRKSSRGWISSYRYKTFESGLGRGAVFIDGSVNRSALIQSMTISGAVLLGCAALIVLLTVLLSNRAVKPIAESYEKQKQFITDANHELKTPLTLILANLDIAETELGKNEWLDDIRSEGQRMTELVNRLVELSRADEEGNGICMTELLLSDIVADSASEFKPLAESHGLTLSLEAEPSVTCRGDEALVRRLISVLLDNAVKYCDAGGEIKITLYKRRRAVLTVENSYRAVESAELNKLFDRFYRADKARTYTGGYGVGLSIAKAIVEKHGGEISAYKKDGTHIGFRAVFKG